MVVPPKHRKMIIFSRETPWLLGTTILGNTHMDVSENSGFIPPKNHPWINRVFSICFSPSILGVPAPIFGNTHL